MITSCSSPMVGTDVQSICMILVDVSLHCALIFLAMESSMMLATTLESNKQLWKLKLKTSNKIRNGGKIDFASSIQSVLSTVDSDLGGVISPLLVEVALSVVVCPSVRSRISR